MSVGIIDPSKLPLVAIPNNVPMAPQTATTARQATAVNLLTGSGFDGKTTVQLADGSTISLPTMSQEERSQVQSIFGRFNPDQLGKLSTASHQLASALYQSMGTTQSPLSITAAAGSTDNTGDTDNSDDDSDSDGGDGSGSDWSAPYKQTQSPLGAGLAPLGAPMPLTQAAEKTPQVASRPAPRVGAVGTVSSGLAAAGATTSPNTSVVAPAVTQGINNAAATYQQVAGQVGGRQGYDNTVQAVTYMGVIGLQQQLYDYAAQVQGNVNAQNTLRVDLEDLNQVLTNWPQGAQTQPFSWTDYDQYGNPVQHTNVQLTEQQAQSLQQNLQSSLTSMSDTNQLQQLQLQQMTQNYQQGVNTISNMLKMQFDTVKSVINNIRAG